MRVTPKTEKEIAEEGLLPKGEYDYEIAEASDEVSKTSGAEMIKLKVRVFVEESERTIYDYLIDTMPGKLKHFCDAHGLQRQYDSGELRASDCEGRSGKCKIDTQKGKNGYADKSGIIDYNPEVGTSGQMTRTAAAPVSAPRPRAPQPVAAGSFDPGISDDDVPF